MLRIHGDCNSLLAALAAHWVDQQLQIPPPLKPQVRPIRRLPGGEQSFPTLVRPRESLH
jgi:hypothetical protein